MRRFGSSQVFVRQASLQHRYHRRAETVCPWCDRLGILAQTWVFTGFWNQGSLVQLYWLRDIVVHASLEDTPGRANGVSLE